MYPANATSSDGLMAVADRLMYIGKKNGRSRMVTADDPELEAQQPLKARSSPQIDHLDRCDMKERAAMLRRAPGFLAAIR